MLKNNQIKRKKLKVLLVLAIIQKQKYQKSRRCWVNELLLKRNEQGHYNNLVAEMRVHEQMKFFNYHRMSVELFDELLDKIKSGIEKLTLTREPISAGARLSLTLRYLASGDMMKSLAYDYRVSEASASHIIAETCDVLWNSLFRSSFDTLTKTKWKSVERGFNNKWNFPNCIGALDGKHITVQAFQNSGSNCFNYKSWHSIVLMAVCDADYNFLVVDIGASGRFSDSGIFRNTTFGKALIEQSSFLNIPSDTFLPNSTISAPHVIVGDEAFPLGKHLMRPFPGRNSSNLLPQPESIFDYRLSRARRVIENAFGILSAKFRIFRKPIHAKRENVVKFVKAAVCLHNYIKKKNLLYCPPGYMDVESGSGEIIEGRWRRETSSDNNGALQRIGRTGSNNPSSNAVEIRNNFKNYFNEIDILPWQQNRIYNS